MKATSALFSLITLMILLWHTSTPAGMVVGGVIDKDVRWFAKKGPYRINRDVLITAQGKLTIDAGTVITIGKPTHYDDSIPQLDQLDSHTVSIKVAGILICQGTRSTRISISSVADLSNQCGWYGIVFDGADGGLNELSFTDIKGACYGITLKKSSPTIRNCAIEYNNVGIQCLNGGDGELYNNVIAHNLTSGIIITESAPIIDNCIIVNNRNNGIWCDEGSASSQIRFNCFFGNADGDLLDCNPELKSMKKRAPNKKDSTDSEGNLYCSPIFAGSSEDSTAIEKDISLPTDKAHILDTALAQQLNGALSDSLAIKARLGHYKRFALSKYSPCKNAGNPDKRFSDPDESRNDIGIYGGPGVLKKK